MGTRKFILNKIIEITIIFFVILTLLFFLFRLSPGSPISKMVDPGLTLEDQILLIEQLGLDRPAFEQYIIYLKNFFTGNLGSSFHYGEPVSSIIMDKLPWTILLFSLSTILAAYA
jgi:peptide/nickel transport system permease protein